MLREHYSLFKRLHLLADLFSVAVVYVVIRMLVAGVPFIRTIEEPALLVVLISLGLVLDAGTRPYEIRLRNIRFTVKTLLGRWVLALGILLAAVFVRPDWAPDRLSVGLLAVAGFGALLSVHLLISVSLRYWRIRGNSYKNALIIGTGTVARQTADAILAQPERGIRVIGFLDTSERHRLWRYRDIPLRGHVRELPVLARSEQIDFALFCLGVDALGQSQESIRRCAGMGIPTVLITDWFGESQAQPVAMDFCGRPALLFERAPQSSVSALAKRVADRTIAAVLLVLLAPVLLLTALAVKLTSAGPVLFSQKRLGLNGRLFTMYKFRTMVENAEEMKSSLLEKNEMSGPVFKLTDDPRLTRLGRFLRRSSIDELPQLINIVKGEMSLVGPRPPLPSEVREYDNWQRRRLSVRPGLTCLWQIQGRNNIDFDEWMRLDLEYIDNWSMAKDAEILLKTIPAVFRGDGAR